MKRCKSTDALAAPQLKSCATASIMAMHRSGEVFLAAREAEAVWCRGTGRFC
jgi:hypothetical protein